MECPRAGPRDRPPCIAITACYNLGCALCDDILCDVHKCERYNVWSALRGCTCLAGMCVWFPVEIMCALCDHSPNAVCAHYARVRTSYTTTDRSSSFYQPRYGWSCDGIARRAARHLDVMVCGTVVILYSPRLLAGSAPPVHPFHQSVSLPIAASQTPQWPRAQHHTYALKNMTLQNIHSL